MIALHFAPKKGIWVEEEDGVDRLRKNFIGTYKNKKIQLTIEEALYLIAFQNAFCYQGDKRISFSDLAAHYPEPDLFVRYNAYRDWRDRGLVIERVHQGKGKAQPLKKYPATPLKPLQIKTKASWFPSDLYAVIDDQETGEKLFDRYWIGQRGVYKQERGTLLVIDFLETIFLAKHFFLPVINIETQKRMSPKALLAAVAKQREYAKQLYDVYEDWRLRGYIVKTGFKFGSHFRIYFPGASPTKEGGYTHSRHVLHVFPKEQKLLISEWARAVRVAHGVKKTFLLGIPELSEKDYVDYPADFLAYRRKKKGGHLVRETPADGPRYLMAAVAEDEHIGGVELASLLKKASDLGTELILSITDRETAITYYILKKIALPNSQYEYYEIEWMKP